MLVPSRVIEGAIVTEKAERLKATESTYTFRVATGANKIQIRQAVERLFKVHVTRVRVLNLMGKERRMGAFKGRRPDWRKAMVTLKKGETIEALER
ncbi:50S ribosomal protein L23 [candidate division WOR-3 bacterium]|nr:50S ribosomal protein L23 [candidate division WOR-3 bacterium]